MAFGSGTNASILLNKTIVDGFKTNWLNIIFGWAFAVAFAVYVGVTRGGPGHLNPARDFGPRAYTLLPVPNRGPTNWGYAWVPIVGPLIGGALAVIFFQCVGV